MSTYVPGFQSFFASFSLAKLGTSSIWGLLQTAVPCQKSTLMVVLGAFAPESCDYATSCETIGAKFANGLINYQFQIISLFT